MIYCLIYVFGALSTYLAILNAWPDWRRFEQGDEFALALFGAVWPIGLIIAWFANHFAPPQPFTTMKNMMDQMIAEQDEQREHWKKMHLELATLVLAAVEARKLADKKES